MDRLHGGTTLLLPRRWEEQAPVHNTDFGVPLPVGGRHKNRQKNERCRLLHPRDSVWYHGLCWVSPPRLARTKIVFELVTSLFSVGDPVGSAEKVGEHRDPSSSINAQPPALTRHDRKRSYFWAWDLQIGGAVEF